MNRTPDEWSLGQIKAGPFPLAHLPLTVKQVGTRLNVRWKATNAGPDNAQASIQLLDLSNNVSLNGTLSRLTLPPGTVDARLSNFWDINPGDEGDHTIAVIMLQWLPIGSETGPEVDTHNITVRVNPAPLYFEAPTINVVDLGAFQWRIDTAIRVRNIEATTLDFNVSAIPRTAAGDLASVQSGTGSIAPGATAVVPFSFTPVELLLQGQIVVVAWSLFRTPSNDLIESTSHNAIAGVV